mgnify:CR=1 FL=1
MVVFEKPKSLTNAELAADLPGQFAYTKKAVWFNEADITTNGNYLKLTFKVLDNAAAGDAQVTVTYADGDISNYDEEDVEFEITAGKITVPATVAEDAPKIVVESTKTMAGKEIEIDLSLLKMNDVSVNYTDLTNGMCASLDDISLMAKGNMKADNLAGELSLSLKKMFYSQTTDSLSMAVRLDEFKVEGDGEMIGDDVKAKLKLSSSTLSYESAEQLAVMNSVNVAYAGDINNNFDHIDGSVTLSLDDMSFSLGNELLLNKADINVKLPLNATLSTMDIELGESQLALNNIVVDLIGNAMISENEDVVVLVMKDYIKTDEEYKRLEKLEDETGEDWYQFESGYSKKMKDGSIIIAFGIDAKETIDKLS